MITRREFLKYTAASAAALGFSEMDILRLKEALAVQCGCGCHSSVPVVWLSGQSCSGCLTSLLNRIADPGGDSLPELDVVQDVADLLVGDAVGHLLGTNPRPGWATFPNGYICNVWNTTIMASAGHLSVKKLAEVRDAGNFVLVVEGATPKRKQGRFCWVFDNEDELNNPIVPVGSPPDKLPAGRVTMRDALRWLAKKAAFIINVGTCSSFGGIPHARGNITKAKSTQVILDREFPTPHGPIVNVPGCPPHPDWIVYPIAYYLIHTAFPSLDERGRPDQIYGSLGNLCDQCSKYSADPGTFSQELGDDIDGCTRNLGCKGWYSEADCPTRGWNRADDGTGMDWCVGWRQGHPLTHGIGNARHVCQGCVEHNFPDGMSPFYEKK